MRKPLAFLGALALVASTVLAADKEKKGDIVTGAWTLSVQGPPAHGDVTGTRQLKQEAAKVTGTLSLQGRNQPLAGEFEKGALTLTTTDTPAEQALSFKAELKADGSLAGHVSTPMGDMKFSAARAKDSK